MMTTTRFMNIVDRIKSTTKSARVVVVALVLTTIGDAQLLAQQQDGDHPIGGQQYQNGQAVRKTAESILSRPEFKHFRRLEGQRGYRGPFELPINGGFGGNGQQPWQPDGGGQNGQNQNRNPNRNQDQDFADNPPPDNGRRNPPLQDNAPEQNDAADDFVPEWGKNDGDFGDGNWDGDGVAEAGGNAQSSAGGAIGGLYTVFAVLMLIVIVGLIVYVVVKSWANTEKKLDSTADAPAERIEGDIEPETAPGELPADVYISEAQKLAN
ncbi:MAG: hypothetical protein O3A00_27530, partial [Planctomycetota bacterium]|nr:hypothetical protein [Planctomycetota bacterium]